MALYESKYEKELLDSQEDIILTTTDLCEGLFPSISSIISFDGYDDEY